MIEFEDIEGNRIKIKRNEIKTIYYNVSVRGKVVNIVIVNGHSQAKDGYMVEQSEFKEKFT